MLGPGHGSAALAKFPLPDPVHNTHSRAEVLLGHCTAASAGRDGPSRAGAGALRVDGSDRSHRSANGSIACSLRSGSIGSDVDGGDGGVGAASTRRRGISGQNLCRLMTLDEGRYAFDIERSSCGTLFKWRFCARTA